MPLEARPSVPALRKPPCGHAHHEHPERHDEKLTMGHNARVAVETSERYKPIYIAPRHRAPPFLLLLVGGWLGLLFLVDDPSLEPIVLLREAVHDRFTRLVPTVYGEGRKGNEERFQGSELELAPPPQ